MTCLIVCLAKILGMTSGEIIELLGHDGTKIVDPNSTKPRKDASQIISKKKRSNKSILIKPLENSLKAVAINSNEHRIHIKNLFTIIPFNNEKKPLSEWLLSKNSAFGKIDHLSFHHRDFNYEGTMEELTRDNLLTLASGNAFYYSNQNNQFNIIGIWSGSAHYFDTDQENDEYLSILVAHYIFYKNSFKKLIK